jgi:hypothetical protein
MTGVVTEVGTRYVVPVERVQQSIEVLLSRKSHPHFPGYMSIRRAAALQGTSKGVRPSTEAIESFLRVKGASPTRPFLRPFWDKARNKHQEWLNENGAGSWAPSSVRIDQPMHKVVEPEDGLFNLRDEHAARALESLLYGERLPALAVAAFLLRDRAIRAEEPVPEALIAAFAKEFGYTNKDLAEFETIYDTNWRGEDVDQPWLEVLPDRSEA